MGDDLQFEACLAPNSVDTFFRDYWERRPLVVSRAQPAYYDGLFSLDDLDAYLHVARPSRSANDILLVNCERPVSSGKIFDRFGQARAALVMSAYRDGDTVTLIGLERCWLPLARFCGGMQGLFRHPVSVNCYLTPPRAQGLGPHFDTHDVCVLQLWGSKTWALYEADPYLPLVSAQRRLTSAEVGGAAQEVLLRPGDFLYLPRGHVHEARTAEDGSLHLTIGINVYRWLDLLIHALEETARADARLRQAVPAGVLLEGNAATRLEGPFRELVAGLPETLRLEDGLRSLERRFLAEQEMLPHRRFASLETLDAIDAETIVRRHPGMLCAVSVESRGAQIAFAESTISAPLRVLEALRFIASRDRFCVKDLPDQLSERAKVVLVRRLVREGLLFKEGTDVEPA